MILVIFVILTLTTFTQTNTQHRHSEKAVEELETYIKEKKSEINPRYRLQYHVAPPVGWMNDPNGFSYFKGEYHIFYQFYPYETVWGPMHWGHFSSPDLVHWNQLPTALIPEEEMCFSGSAVVDGDTMILMYTGRRITDEEPYFNETQYLAFSDDGRYFHKYEGNPVLSYTPNGASDFRDPKVWKHGDYWYVIIGSTTSDERGRVILYRSTDMKDWKYLTVLAESDGDSYMWECPDFFELDGRFVLLMSPQGMKSKGDRFINLYQTGYIIGDFSYETFEFIPKVEFQEIDFGHDFYATQTLEENGKRYLFAWFGMWEDPHPEDVDGWVNALTIVRELRLSDDNRILSKPVDAMMNLRKDVVVTGSFVGNQSVDFNSAAEIIVEGDLNEKIELLLEGLGGDGDEVKLKWDPETGKVVVDRNGNIRQVEWVLVNGSSWRIFLDTCSLELFCGEGEVVFSSRVYPNGGWRVTNLSTQTIRVKGYNLKRSVPE